MHVISEQQQQTRVVVATRQGKMGGAKQEVRINSTYRQAHQWQRICRQHLLPPPTLRAVVATIHTFAIEQTVGCNDRIRGSAKASIRTATGASATAASAAVAAACTTAAPTAAPHTPRGAAIATE